MKKTSIDIVIDTFPHGQPPAEEEDRSHRCSKQAPNLSPTASSASSNFSTLSLTSFHDLDMRSPATPLTPDLCPVAWLWTCHLCGRRYPLGVTRRCLVDGHYFCAGQITERLPGGRTRRRACTPCSSEFDYIAWAKHKEWKLAHSLAPTDPNQQDCRQCSYPNECRYTRMGATTWQASVHIEAPQDQETPCPTAPVSPGSKMNRGTAANRPEDITSAPRESSLSTVSKSRKQTLASPALEPIAEEEQENEYETAESTCLYPPASLLPPSKKDKGSHSESSDAFRAASKTKSTAAALMPPSLSSPTLTSPSTVVERVLKDAEKRVGGLGGLDVCTASRTLSSSKASTGGSAGGGTGAEKERDAKQAKGRARHKDRENRMDFAQMILPVLEFVGTA